MVTSFCRLHPWPWSEVWPLYMHRHQGQIACLLGDFKCTFSYLPTWMLYLSLYTCLKMFFIFAVNSSVDFARILPYCSKYFDTHSFYFGDEEKEKDKEERHGSSPLKWSFSIFKREIASPILHVRPADGDDLVPLATTLKMPTPLLNGAWTTSKQTIATSMCQCSSNYSLSWLILFHFALSVPILLSIYVQKSDKFEIMVN